MNQSSLGKIYIKKRSISEWFVLVILVFPFLFGTLFEILSLPNFVRFCMDAILIYFLVTFAYKRTILVRRPLVPIIKFAAIFFVYTLVVYCFNFQSPFYYIWGVRNNFRFFVAFLVFAFFIDEDYANSIFKLFEVLFWVNIVVSLFQFIFMGVAQDDLGGLFGSTGSTNAYTLVFFIIMISKSLLATFEKKESPGYCALKCIASLVVAAMAEMKFYYFVFIILLFLASVLTKFSRRKLVLWIVSTVAVLLGSIFLSYMFKEFENFLSLKQIWQYATNEHYSSQKDINRLSAIFTLMKNYVTEPLQQIFGMGLGNCDLSEVSIFNSVFHQKYEFLHYSWFTSAMIFLETGFLGIVIYLSFFVLCLRRALAQLKLRQGNKLYCQMTVIMALMCFVLFFYNSALRIESGYMIYFVLALPFMAKNDQPKIG